MSTRKCCVGDCSRTDIVAMQRQIRINSLPDDSDLPLPTTTISFSYYCTIHFDSKELWKKNVKLIPATAITGLGNIQCQNVVPYSNRKRKADVVEADTKRIKAKDDDTSLYTLNDKTHSVDNTKVNVNFPKFEKFDSEEYEDSGDPTTLMEIGKSDSAKTNDDNDCMITDGPTETIIDLEAEEGSNKMIELILCDDTESEPSEVTREYVADMFSGTEDEDIQRPCEENFLTLEDDVDAIEIDLTAEKNGIACEDANPSQSIDLTDEQLADDETNVDVERYRTAVINKMKRKLRSQYPQVVQSISWNDKSQQFEVSISKKSGFKVNDTFQKCLRETVNEAVQNWTLVKRTMIKNRSKETPNIQANKTKILNKEYTRNKPQLSKSSTVTNTNGNSSSTSKTLVPTSYKATSLDQLSKSSVPTNQNGNSSSTSANKDENFSSTSNMLGLVPGTSSKSKSEKPLDFNDNEILRNAESYLGVSAKTFRRIEALVPFSFPNRSILILLLRKTKLNESFSTLCDVLCPKMNDGTAISMYKNYLEMVSRALTRFLEPYYSRKPLTVIIDVLEIEIQKPDSMLQQSLSFCNQRQRYLVKFIICLTSNGLVTHLSPPFHTFNSSLLTPCLAKIPKSLTVVANPNLLNFAVSIPIVSLFDHDRQVERDVSKHLFHRMRRFSRISCIEELKDVKILQQTVTLVACLCNLECQ